MTSTLDARGSDRRRPRQPAQLDRPAAAAAKPATPLNRSLCIARPSAMARISSSRRARCQRTARQHASRSQGTARRVHRRSRRSPGILLPETLWVRPAPDLSAAQARQGQRGPLRRRRPAATRPGCQQLFRIDRLSASPTGSSSCQRGRLACSSAERSAGHRANGPASAGSCWRPAASAPSSGNLGGPSRARPEPASPTRFGQALRQPRGPGHLGPPEERRLRCNRTAVALKFAPRLVGARPCVRRRAKASPLRRRLPGGAETRCRSRASPPGAAHDSTMRASSSSMQPREETKHR